MSSYYVYLISSLPMLDFQVKPLINAQKFLEVSCDLIPEREFNIIKALLEGEITAHNNSPILKRWFDFDTSLRNELVKLRAGRKRKDPGQYIREDNYWNSQVVHAAMSAFKSVSLLEAEKLLDLERWLFLDELCFGHYFDFEFLVIYALKLQIIERRERVKSANKLELLEEVLN